MFLSEEDSASEIVRGGKRFLSGDSAPIFEHFDSEDSLPSALPPESFSFSDTVNSFF